MVSNPVSEICEHVAEVQALLDDHRAGGKDSAADVVAKAQAVLSEPELLRCRILAAEHAAAAWNSGMALTTTWVF
jgi:hypothetical protein